MKLMLRLRLTNPVPAHLAHHAPFQHLRPESPLKPRIEPGTGRAFQVISLPQKDGTFVASVVEAPSIRVYNRSREAAEEKASQKFLKTPDPYAFRRHPLALSKDVTIEMEYDPDAAAFVTYVKELHRMSSFGETEMAALDNTVEMIRGYIKSMDANRNEIPLAASKLANLRRLVGLV
jgi:predicted RNase H-like HicB family nuclease